MADRIALRGRGSALAALLVGFGVFFVTYGWIAVLWGLVLPAALLLHAQWRSNRWQQEHPGESYPPRPKPVRVHVVSTRVEAGLLLTTFLALGVAGMSIAIGFVVDLGTVVLTGSRKGVDGDWTTVLYGISIVTAVLTFLAYAVLAARSTRRRGEPGLQMSEVASPAALRQVVTQFRSRPSV